MNQFHPVLDLQKSFDPEVLKQYILQGLLSAHLREDLGILVLHYVEDIPAHLWDEVLAGCQSVGLDIQTGEVVFRGPGRVFHQDEKEIFARMSRGFKFYESTEFLDGVLGIGFERNGLPWVMLESGVDSVLAQKASALLQQQSRVYWPKGFSPFFEIILPETRNLIDYGDQADLIWLGLVENATGREMRHADVEQYAILSGMRCVQSDREYPSEVTLGLIHPWKGVVLSYRDEDHHVRRSSIRSAWYLEQAGLRDAKQDAEAGPEAEVQDASEELPEEVLLPDPETCSAGQESEQEEPDLAPEEDF